jgi:hypothetical protein
MCRRVESNVKIASILTREAGSILGLAGLSKEFDRRSKLDGCYGSFQNWYRGEIVRVMKKEPVYRRQGPPSGVLPANHY